MEITLEQYERIHSSSRLCDSVEQALIEDNKTNKQGNLWLGKQIR